MFRHFCIRNFKIAKFLFYKLEKKSRNLLILTIQKFQIESSNFDDSIFIIYDSFYI